MLVSAHVFVCLPKLLVWAVWLFYGVCGVYAVVLFICMFVWVFGWLVYGRLAVVFDAGVVCLFGC